MVERESQLYFLRHGHIFHDPLGEFSARREEFARYPSDVLLKRINDECWSVWHFGEYKFRSRLAHRKDSLAIQMCLGHFIESAMRVCFLLNDDFSPYWMWLPHEFRKLPSCRAIRRRLSRLVRIDDLAEQSDLVSQICACLRRKLVRHNLLTTDRPLYGLGSKEIRKKIKDKIIREAE